MALAIVVVVGLLCTFVRSSLADDRAAEAHFQRGITLFDSGDYAGAADAFRAAYATAPDFRVLYNIGQATQRAQHPAAARAAFQRYLAEGESRVPADRRQRVEAALVELDGLVGRLRINVDAPGARVLLDGEAVGTAPLGEPVLCDPGRRTVRAEKDGASTETAVDVVSAGSGGDTVVTLKLRATQAAALPPPPPAEPRRSSYLGPALLGAGGVVTVTAVILDVVVVRSELEEFDELRGRDDPAAGEARSRARTFQTTALISYVVGAALVGVGAAITFWPKRASTSSAAPSMVFRF